MKRRKFALEQLEQRRLLAGTVVFNELMYHSADNDRSDEWIELHNQMWVDMDVSQWRLAGSVDFTFPRNTVVPARGYLVVAADPDQLESRSIESETVGPFPDGSAMVASNCGC